MSVQFHTLTISDVLRVTADAVAITFDVPEELRPVFLYKHGQYITIKVEVDGVSHRRNYSLCSSPVMDEPLTIAVKRVNDGVVSSWIDNHAVAGLKVEVYPPMGNFTKDLDPTHVRHYTMFAGGSGITPILSILKSILRVEKESVVTLFYANRNKASVIFSDTLDQLVASSNGKFRLVQILEDNLDASDASLPGSLYTGIMDALMLERLIADYVPSFGSVEAFVCGPGPMMDNVIRVLHSHNLDDKKIHREYFTLNKDNMESEIENSATAGEADEVVTRSVTIRIYGTSFTFDVEPDETILTAAQRANVDPPYACQIGACCTCRAKLLTGKVHMDEREALSDDEIEDGYILTCQSHPLTADVVADYDQ
ncbi:MAG: 2Fe-2S iron-sulfur cluster binding domain-containing protein [Ignavibacteria bacterium]|nr:2Fe-2S iron-sulfur cluster binding domain-containing protein [Ignavibacteria bacterium]